MLKVFIEKKKESTWEICREIILMKNGLCMERVYLKCNV
jgi:hypothetical protein